MPISIQMALAFYVAAINPLIISSLPSIGRDYIYLDSREPTEYNAICHRSLDHLLYLYVRVIVIVLTTVLLAYTGGVYAMLVNDRAATSVFSASNWALISSTASTCVSSLRLPFIFRWETLACSSSLWCSKMPSKPTCYWSRQTCGNSPATCARTDWPHMGKKSGWQVCCGASCAATNGLSGSMGSSIGATFCHRSQSLTQLDSAFFANTM